MVDKIIDLNVSNQIENSKTNLKLLNIQLEFYNKLLDNAKTKEEKKKYQNKINDILLIIEEKLDLLDSISNI